jgi:hypothetical protein
VKKKQKLLVHGTIIMEHKMKPEKLIRDGLVAVLYSPGYGAGWSTWQHDEELCEFLLFDRNLVEMKERGATEEEVKDLLSSLIGSDIHIYLGGWDQIEIAWMPQGTNFRINEYDGSEGIELAAEIGWLVA